MTEENKEVQTVTIGEKIYLADSLTEHGVNIINDVRSVETRIKQLQLDVAIADLARGKLMEELQKEVPKFTEIEKPVEEGEIVEKEATT